MDPKRFDAIARSLTAASSRRSALAGLLVGFMAPLVGNAETEAKRNRRRGRGNPRQNGMARGRDSGDRVGVEKKHKRHKKKPQPGCSSNCAGKACGAGDGCGGVCQSGTCSSGASCVKGQCLPDGGGCTPACTGGRVCQSNGTCACPPDKPHSGGYCDDTCRECCTSDDCPDRYFMECRHDLGSICVCSTGTFECNGICQSCCADGDCAAHYRPPSNGFICNANHGCECQNGSECILPDQSAYFCADLLNDKLNCGFCGVNCQGWNCVAGECIPPG
jgi:hypothetical protein